MQAGSIPDVYACVAEYCLDADDTEFGVKDGVERLSMASPQPLWTLLSGFLFGTPA